MLHVMLRMASIENRITPHSPPPPLTPSRLEAGEGSDRVEDRARDAELGQRADAQHEVGAHHRGDRDERARRQQHVHLLLGEAVDKVGVQLRDANLAAARAHAPRLRLRVPRRW